MIAAVKPMTEEEFMSLPDDGIERWLVGGEVKEWGMPARNKFHSITMGRLAHKLVGWRDAQSPPRGEVYVGDASFRLPTNPPRIVGCDLAYAGPSAIAQDFPNSLVFQGPPTLAVEILSPSDTQDGIYDKLESYLAGGTAMVWIVHLKIKVVAVHCPGQVPIFYTVEQVLTGDPVLPGLRIAVADLFA